MAIVTARQPEQFEIRVPTGRVDDLHARLKATRFAPDRDATWEYGLPTGLLDQWVARWLDFDWEAAQRALNGFDHFRVDVDGIALHYVLRRGRGPAPVPLLLLHGWPWTFWDWHASIDRLADPGAYGGDPEDAFDVVVVSLPGFTFSTPLAVRPMGFTQMADVFVKLMRDVLGYERFAVAGGDMGALAAEQLGHKHADSLIGLQLFGVVPLGVFRGESPLDIGPDFGMARPAEMPADPVFTPAPALRRRTPSAHLTVHALEPQTLAAALTDSPAGLLAWLLHRRATWSDNDGDVLDAFDADFLLTTFSLYWYTDSIGSSMKAYHDMVFHSWQASHDRRPVVEAPTGITFFDRDELTGRSRSWCPDYFNIRRASSYPHGGHFGPAEEPDIASAEIRETFRLLR